MPDINDLPLIAEQSAPENVGELPEFASFGPALQPGYVTLQIPATVAECYEVTQSENGQKIMAQLRAKHALKVKGKGLFSTTISNMTRKVNDVTISDMGMLLQALGFKGVLSDNKSYALALNQYAGHWFDAEVDLQANCSGKRDIRDEEGNEKKGVKGCGIIYRTYLPKKAGKNIVKLIPQVDGKFSEKFVCSCGAVVRAFNNLRNFRAAS